ncbi:hypothetical protein AcV7_001609 [Taiwanofungus camphoratus]|nr:hypothetical protein AcV7_001609 [Antrodia cinnamomea]
MVLERSSIDESWIYHSDWLLTTLFVEEDGHQSNPHFFYNIKPYHRECINRQAFLSSGMRDHAGSIPSPAHTFPQYRRLASGDCLTVIHILYIQVKHTASTPSKLEQSIIQSTIPLLV